jgi:hypothetical protein
LSACTLTAPEGDGPAGNGGLFKGFAAAKAPKSTPLTKATVAGGDLVLGGAKGYCIDKSSLVTRQNRSFALLGLCTVMAGRGTGGQAASVITVTVAPNPDTAAPPSPEALAKGLGAPLLDARTSDGITLAHLGRHGSGVLPNGDEAHWRAVFDHNGLMIGLALYAPPASRLTDAEGGTVLLSTVDRIRQLNPEKTAAPASEDKPKRKLSLPRLFRKTSG